MTRGAKPHPLEVLADASALGALTTAAGWSVWSITANPVATAFATIAALASGKLATRWLGGSRSGRADAAFVPVPFEEALVEDELLLDDPLVAIGPDARVVRLFEQKDATPGELVARITDFLGERTVTSMATTSNERPVDASAALHTALANIRASLR